MNSSLLKNSLLVGRIILPAILCVFFVILFENLEYFKFNSMYFIISSPGIIIVLLNLKKLKYNIVISLLLSLNLCFFAFYGSMAIGAGIFYFLEKIISLFGLNTYELNNILFNSSNASIAIIAPLLIFYLYSFILKINRTRFFYLIILSSIVILIALGLTNVLFVYNVKMFVVWQFIVVLTLQLILYQNELKELFKPKNE